MRRLGSAAGRRAAALVATAYLVLALAGCSSSGAHARSTTTVTPRGVQLSCEEGGPTFPPSALRSSPTADQGNGELAGALRRALTPQILATTGSRPHGWRMLYDTGSRAGFLSAPTESAPGGMFVQLAKTNGRWGFFNSGGCNREVTRPGLVAAQWAVDPAYGSPKAGDAQVHVVVGDPECNDGRVLTRDRIHPPVVAWTTRTVMLAMYLTPVAPGLHKCPAPAAPSGQTGIDGIAAVAYTVDLGRPLGAHQLLDGSSYPPRPPDVGTR
ncbi:MAG TPA: hypothetical protein VMT43_05285 [Acidimicrobiales bacterium]|nr:hypothetical protein [Acidimicrobiales bacterium]